MGLSFLAAPQTSDQQVEQTGAQFQSGVRMGHQDAVEAQQRVADAAAAVAAARQKALDAQAKLNEKAVEHKTATVNAENTALVSHVRSRIASDLAANRALLEKDVSDAPTLDKLRQNIRDLTDEGTEFDETAGKTLAATPPGEPVQFAPKFLKYTGVPATADLSPQVKEAAVNKNKVLKFQADKLQTEAAANGSAAAGAAPPKVAVAPQKAVTDLSVNTTMLTEKADRLDNLAQYKSRLDPRIPDPLDASKEIVNPAYTEAQLAYNRAAEDYVKTSDGIGSNYAAVIKHLRSGAYGQPLADAFGEVTKGTPLDLTDVNTHPAVRNVVGAILTSLKNKQGLFGLTPADQVRQAVFTRLGTVLSIDQDPAGLLQKRAALNNPPPMLPPPDSSSTADQSSTDTERPESTDTDSTGGTP